MSEKLFPIINGFYSFASTSGFINLVPTFCLITILGLFFLIFISETSYKPRFFKIVFFSLLPGIVSLGSLIIFSIFTSTVSTVATNSCYSFKRYESSIKHIKSSKENLVNKLKPIQRKLALAKQYGATLENAANLTEEEAYYKSLISIKDKGLELNEHEVMVVDQIDDKFQAVNSKNEFIEDFELEKYFVQFNVHPVKCSDAISSLATQRKEVAAK